MRRFPIALAAACALGGCSEGATIDVVVEGDIDPGVDVDFLELGMWNEGAQVWTERHSLAPSSSWPLSFRVSPPAEGVSTVEISVEATLEGRQIVAARRPTSFVAGRRVEARFCLWRECIDGTLPWCAEGRCDRTAGDGGADADAGRTDAAPDAADAESADVALDVEREADGDGAADGALDADAGADAETSPVPPWVVTLGGDSDDHGLAMAAAPDGSVVLTGLIQGTVDLDPGPGELLHTVRGETDAFVLRLDASGALLWGVAFGGDGAEWGTGVAMADDGSVAVTGWFDGVGEFDPGPDTVEHAAVGDQDGFILCLDGEGRFAWVAIVTGEDREHVWNVTSAPSGRFVAVGWASGTVDLDPGAGEHLVEPVGYSDIFVVSLDSAGGFEWGHQLGGGGIDVVSDVKAHESGTIALAGQFTGAVDLDPGAGEDLHTAQGIGDAFVLGFDASGAALWSRVFSGEGADHARAVAFGLDGSMLIGGTFSGGPIDLDPGAGSDTRTAGEDEDAFVVRLGPTGEYLGGEVVRGLEAQAVSDVLLRPDGTGVVVGNFSGSLELGAGLGGTVSSQGYFDIFLLGVSGDGAVLDATTLGSPESESVTGAGEAGAGGVLVGGRIKGLVDLDPGPGVLEVSPVGGIDAFVARLVFP